MEKKIYNQDLYPNLLDKINLTSLEIVEQTKSFKLVFSRIKDKRVEWGMQLPMFVPAFYDFIIQNGKVPSQVDFYNHYIMSNSDFFHSGTFDKSLFPAIMARAYRTYPSLVRDVCFNKYVQEHISGYSVVYNIDLDVSEGIDLMLSQGDNHFAINLFTQTNRAYAGRAKKAYRHTPFENVKYIDFPVNFNGSYQNGDFFLYWDAEYQQLISKLS